MIRTIARARNLPAECIVPGAGSSALIFLCFREWLNQNSRILLLDPTLRGIQSHHRTHPALPGGSLAARYATSNCTVDTGELEARLQAGYDLVVIVNPNSPTGPAHTALRTRIRP